MKRSIANRAADTLNQLITAHVSDDPTDIDVHEAMAVRDELRDVADGLQVSKFEVGDYAVDDKGPTPSLELNTVEVVDVIDQRADQFYIDEMDQTVAEHSKNQAYPDDDMIVAGVYTNLNDDSVWHFPESRLRKA